MPERLLLEIIQRKAELFQDAVHDGRDFRVVQVGIDVGVGVGVRLAGVVVPAEYVSQLIFFIIAQQFSNDVDAVGPVFGPPIKPARPPSSDGGLGVGHVGRPAIPPFSGWPAPGAAPPCATLSLLWLPRRRPSSATERRHNRHDRRPRRHDCHLQASGCGYEFEFEYEFEYETGKER